MPNLTQVIPFSLSTNYVYNPSLIRISSGQALLSGGINPTDYTEDFNDAAGLTFNAADIEIVGGTHAALKLQDNAGLTFNQPFTSGVGFTYNALKTQIAAGVLSQIQKAYRPSYYLGTAFANYDTSIDLTYGDGVLTGAATGGASISGGKLDLKGATVKYVDYAGLGNASNMSDRGCIRFKFTPNYSGTPASQQNMVCISQAAGNDNNLIMLRHRATNGTIQVIIYTSAATFITIAETGVYNATAGVEVEFELNFDVVAGATRLFLNGNQLGATIVSTGIRSTTIGLLRIGSNTTAATTIDGEINDLILYDTPQHSSNYIPEVYGIAYYPTFYAGYPDDVNGDWGDGVLTGTAVGGASVSGGKLDLNYSDLRYVTYPVTGNAASQQKMCIRFKVTPNYSGTPATSLSFIVILEDGTSNNEIVIFHQTGTGELRFNQRDATGATEASGGAAWNPTASTEYEIELNIDLDSSETRLFVDGVLHASDLVTSGTRSASSDIIKVGTNGVAALTSNFSIDDVIIYADPQHTADYTPNWTGINSYEYEPDEITFPGFSYTGAGSVQAFTNFAETATNNSRYTIDGLYWTGAAWAASSSTYATASPAADILANIATLPASDTPAIKLYTEGNIGSQVTVDDVTLTYTGQTYPTSNPTIDLDTPIVSSNPAVLVSAINTFVATMVAAGGDAVTFSLSNDNQASFLYYNGASWVASTNYATSSTNAQITAGLSTFPVTLDGLYIKVYLHSNDGSTTPEISNLTVNYNDGSFITGVDPTIYYTTPITARAILSISSSEIAVGSDEVRHVLNINNVDYWWDGAAWAASTSYAQANPMATIAANLASLNVFIALGVSMYIKTYLHGDNGVTTPSIDNIAWTYTFTGVPTVVNECLVWGNVIDSQGDPIQNVTVTATQTRDTKLGDYIVDSGTAFSTTTNALGYWELSLVNNAEMSPSAQYDFVFSSSVVNYADRKTVPNQATANYNTLVG